MSDHLTDDQTRAAMETATTWLVDNWHVAPQPLTRTLRDMFGLKFLDAVKVMAKARDTVEARK